MSKRLFDLSVSGMGLIVLSPLFLIVALLIKIADGGPVFYRGWRVGRFGQPFRIFKFRSMVAGAEKMGGPSTPDDDPRITFVGRILRKYKLDELPQLLNVVLGQMSLVGPRPEVKYYTDLYTAEEKAILNLRPGITDWASIWNSAEGALLAGADDPEKAYLELIRPTKLKLQLQYAREVSWTTDLKIIFLTLREILRPRRRAVASLKRQVPAGALKETGL
jgi:lipopolysaccharide/colanic/teichoic acid biosynthesis glycosyltransferase